MWVDDGSQVPASLPLVALHEAASSKNKDKKQSWHHSTLSNELEQETLPFNPFLLPHNYRGLLQIWSSSPPLMSPSDPISPLGARFSAQHLLMNVLIKLGWGTSTETAADSSEGRGKHSRGFRSTLAVWFRRGSWLKEPLHPRRSCFKGSSPPTKTLNMTIIHVLLQSVGQLRRWGD